jgi:tetratricopeptide (TPR) repeat protein
MLNQTRWRITAYHQHGEASVVGSDDAAEEAYQLFDAGNGTELAAEVAQAVAWLFWCRYRAFGSAPDRECATQLFTQLLSDLPPQLREEVPGVIWTNLPPLDETPVWASLETWAEGVSDALWESFQVTRSGSDLYQATLYGRAAVTASPGADLGRRASKLSNMLRTAFEESGDEVALHQAVHHGRMAVENEPTGSPYRVRALCNLGTALTARFRHRGDGDDIREAIDVLLESVSLASGPEEAATCQSGLASALSTRAAHTDLATDLNEAVSLYRQALNGFPDGHAERVTVLSNLGTALHLRYKRFADIADLDAAVTVLGQVTAQGHPRQAMCAVNLGQALLTRFALSGQAADVEHAAEALQTAVNITPDGHPELANRLNTLAAALRHRPDGGPAAERAWRRAGELSTAAPAVRMAAYNAWAEWAASRGDWASAAEGYAGAVTLLPRIAAGVSRGSQERVIEDWTGLASDAAACAVAAGRPGDAVIFLEQGRAVMAAALLNMRSDLTALREAEPGLAEALERVRIELESVMPMTGESHAVDRRLALSRQWDVLVAQVQELAGFESFLRPPKLEGLLAAAEGGPTVIINVSRWRCDALIVGQGGVRALALPFLSAEDAGLHANRYLHVLQEAENARARGDAARAQAQQSGLMAHRQAAQKAQRSAIDAATAVEPMLTDLMRWTWDVIAEPVLGALLFTHAPRPNDPWPRVWWCPTGPLTLLPLHAAGDHRRSHESAAPTVIDRVVSSYTPTLRALIEARKPVNAKLREHGRVLFVGQADTPGQPSLRGVSAERTVLEELIPLSRRTLLEGEEATREAVQRELREHSWVHFSCHGDQKLDDPSRGGLVLHDGELTITDVMNQYYHAEFAGLSACKTATGGVGLVDEAVTLTAALHYAGYRHVVGALWSVNDDNETTQLFRGLYGTIAKDGRLDVDGSAQALHAAIRSLRDSNPSTPSAWTAFTHTGP